jgi:hypothetical protein
LAKVFDVSIQAMTYRIANASLFRPWFWKYILNSSLSWSAMLLEYSQNAGR